MAKDKAVIPRSETEDFAAEVVAEKRPQKQRYKKNRRVVCDTGGKVSAHSET